MSATRIAAVMLLGLGISGASLAQPGLPGPPMICSLSSVPLVLRSNGVSESTGDLIISCTGGSVLAPGTTLPQTNVVVQMNVPITNRITNGWADAFLIVDEPGSGLYGVTNVQSVCTGGVSGCTTVANGTGTGSYDGSAGKPNIFQGTVSGNTVTFWNVPIEPAPALQRTLRITGIRVDATLWNGGVDEGQVVAFVSSSGTTSLPLPNAQRTVGYVTPPLRFQVRTPDDSAFSSSVYRIPNCGIVNQDRLGVLRFQSGVSGVFRVRTKAPYIDPFHSPTPQPQNVPGDLFVPGLVESGFYIPDLVGPGGSLATAGLADFGTRLKATITDLPPGATLWVGVQSAAFTNGVAAPSTTSVARYVPQESGPFVDGPIPGAVTIDGLAAVQVPVVNGTAVAVWEVLKIIPWAATETLDFPIWISYMGSASGAASINVDFAPYSSSPLTDSFVPRFVPGPYPSLPLFRAAGCAPALIAPSSGATEVSLTPTLTWTAVPGATSYDVYFGDSGTPPLVTRVNQTNWSPGTLIGGKTYYWKVAARNAFVGAGPASAMWSFTTQAETTPPDLAIAVAHSGNLTRGQSGVVYTITVRNVGDGAATAGATAAAALSQGLTATAISGAGWTCGLATLTCWRAGVLPQGAAYPPIILTVNVAPDAPQSVTNTVSVYGQGDNNPANDSAADTASVAGGSASVSLALAANPAAGGAVTATPSGSSFTPGTNVQIQAQANSGYLFAGFTGALTGLANPQTLQITQSSTVTANFVPISTDAADQLVFALIAGGPLPAAQTLQAGSPAIVFAGTGGNWLVAAPGPAGPVQLSLDGTVIAGLDAGTYIAYVVVGSGTQQRAVTVKLMIDVASISRVAEAAGYSTQMIASEEWVTVMGVNLAGETAQANGLPLPTTLGGTMVNVIDGAGVVRLAQLLYVSSNQINLLTPAGMAPGSGSLVISNGAGQSVTCSVQIAATAPGLFSGNQSGSGVATAVVQSVAADGKSTFMQAAVCDPVTGQCTPNAIDLSNPSVQVYLSLYGTGIRSVSGKGGIAVTVGGIPAEVLFAGAQSGYPGLDQVNVRLTSDMAGLGDVAVSLTVDGHAANSVSIRIR